MTETSADVDEMICDGGRGLWPVRWNLWRHGTWSYRVTAIPEASAEPFDLTPDNPAT